jgi:hypothetical protein
VHSRTVAIIGLVGAVGAFGTACARTVARLSPAPTATPVQGPGRGAVATAAGVSVIARAEAWQWDPPDLNTKVTPILLELQNDGTHEVLVRYNRIWLVDADGHRFNAMPPYNIEGTLSEPFTVQNPYYGFNRFAIAPYLSRYYPRFSRYGGSFAYDQAYYSPYYTTYAQVRLPTADMVQRALPEGVLSAGGRAMGFVYFQALHRDARQVTLVVEIVDAATGTPVGTARIPFVAG